MVVAVGHEDVAGRVDRHIGGVVEPGCVAGTIKESGVAIPCDSAQSTRYNVEGPDAVVAAVSDVESVAQDGEPGRKEELSFGSIVGIREPGDARSRYGGHIAATINAPDAVVQFICHVDTVAAGIIGKAGRMVELSIISGIAVDKPCGSVAVGLDAGPTAAPFRKLVDTVIVAVSKVEVPNIIDGDSRWRSKG